MKKRILALTIIGSMMLCFIGCRQDDSISVGEEQNQSINVGEEQEPVQPQQPGNSIQAELDVVEATYQEILSRDRSHYSQADMNAESHEMYELWDNELNALWTQIKDALDDSAYENLLDEQREWIKRKELHIRAYGAAGFGGSIQPCLEDGAAADITRVRCYELAKILADAKGEQFATDIVDAYKDYYDPLYDDVMWGFRGPHEMATYDESTGELMISHETDEWEAIITYNGVRQNVEVWGYNSERIIWKSADGDFFEIGRSWEGDLKFVCRDDIREFIEYTN